MRKIYWRRAVTGALLLGLMAGEQQAVAEPVTLQLDVSSPGVTQSVSLPYSWDDDWFGRDAYGYNHDLARVAGALMSTVYLQVQYNELTTLLADLGCAMETLEDHHYQAVEPEYPDKSAYSFCTKMVTVDGEMEPLVIVTVRGTAGRQEWLSNANVADSTHDRQKYHEGFWKSSQLIAADLAKYMEHWGLDWKQTRFLVTGHSRGAAVANLLGAYLDEARAVPAHVYVYTFATPNSCSDLGVRTAARYKNIFNIVNPEDIVPQLPFIKGSWGYGSFGTTLLLPTANNLRGNPTYYEKLLERMQVPFGLLTHGRHYTPIPGSEWLARDVKGMQWMLVGSVPQFYTQARMTNHTNFVNVLNNMEEDTDERAGIYYRGMMKTLTRWFPEERAGFEDMHAPATYNAWILSGTPQDIYRRGTPSLIRIQLPKSAAADAESTARKTRIQMALGQTAPDIPFDMELRIPGGEVVMRVHDGQTDPAYAASDYPVRNDGYTVSFAVPEDSQLEMQLTARSEVPLRIQLGLEANKENGLNAMADPLVEKEILLKKGQQKVFVINNRKLQ